MSWLGDPELIALIEADYAERGVRLYGYKLNHLVDVYNVFRRWSADNHVTSGQTAWSQLGARLYDDVFDKETGRKKRESLRRWTRELQRLGVLQVREHKNQRGAFDGIWWALPSDVASARSSAGSSVGSCGYRRRQETRQEAAERRVRPWCRRSGRKGVDRFVPGTPTPVRPPFSGTTVGPSIAPRSLKGPGGVLHDVTRAALAVDTGSPSSGAPPALQGSDVGNGTAAPLTSTAATRTRSAAPDRAAELQQALDAFERRFGRPSLPVTPQTFRLWLQATRRGDRYGGWGRAVPGLAAGYVVDRIEAWTAERPRTGDSGRGDVERRRVAEPASIAYFVALLDDASKHWRHAYRHHHGLCRRPELCRANAWMHASHGDRLRRRDKWVAYDREVDHVRRVLNDAGYTSAAGDPSGRPTR